MPRRFRHRRYKAARVITLKTGASYQKSDGVCQVVLLGKVPQRSGMGAAHRVCRRLIWAESPTEFVDYVGLLPIRGLCWGKSPTDWRKVEGGWYWCEV